MISLPGADTAMVACPLRAAAAEACSAEALTKAPGAGAAAGATAGGAAPASEPALGASVRARLASQGAAAAAANQLAFELARRSPRSTGGVPSSKWKFLRLCAGWPLLVTAKC
jgi:hypothetical protein